MISVVQPQQHTTLADYESFTFLASAVERLRAEAAELVPKLKGRTVWMVNSTAQGGGVAEMMPKMLGLFRELGVDVHWVVISPEDERFFTLTKQLHNLIHGAGDPFIGEDARELYRETSRALADAFRDRLRDDDLLVVHDPQPAGMGAMLKEELGVTALWRSHIGLDRDNAATQTAWDFLEPWVTPYDRAVFSLEAYVPDYLQGRTDILHPAIDPLSHKNRPLSPHKLAGVLSNAGLLLSVHPVLTPPFQPTAQRLQADGTFAPAVLGEDLGLLYRPIVTQISRWDRLKGWTPLMKAFARIKNGRHDTRRSISPRHARRLDMVRLVLAGPDPDSIQDDPEGLEVFNEICGLWHELPAGVQRDVAVLSLPMSSRKANALMVNALQRCSTVVVQNSLQEGFGLTVTEAMWKGVPVLGSSAAGIRAQVVPEETGLIVENATDPEEVAGTLDRMLEEHLARDAWGRNGQRRVYEHFLVFTQVRRWLEVLAAAC